MTLRGLRYFSLAGAAKLKSAALPLSRVSRTSGGSWTEYSAIISFNAAALFLPGTLRAGGMSIITLIMSEPVRSSSIPSRIH